MCVLESLLRNEIRNILVGFKTALRAKHKMTGKKKRKVSEDVILFALKKTLERDGSSILQISDDHYKILARRLNISQGNIKDVISRMQPIVKLLKK